MALSDSVPFRLAAYWPRFSMKARILFPVLLDFGYQAVENLIQAADPFHRVEVPFIREVFGYRQSLVFVFFEPFNDHIFLVVRTSGNFSPVD